jgi:hypothetical protein
LITSRSIGTRIPAGFLACRQARDRRRDRARDRPSLPAACGREEARLAETRSPHTKDPRDAHFSHAQARCDLLRTSQPDLDLSNQATNEGSKRCKVTSVSATSRCARRS